MTQKNNNTQVYTLEQLTAAVNNLSNGVISHEEGIANLKYFSIFSYGCFDSEKIYY